MNKKRNKLDKSFLNALSLKISDIYIPIDYINKLISTRIIKVVIETKVDNKVKYNTLYLNEDTYINKKDNKIVEKKVIKYNEAKWRLSLAFFKFFYKEKVEMLFSISELQRIAKCSNIRENLEEMKEMGLINFEDTQYGVKIYLLNSVEIKVKNNTPKREMLPYVYLPMFCVDEAFFAEEVGVQKLFLYYLANLSYKSNDKFNVKKKEVMRILGIHNTSRMDTYINRLSEILNIEYKKEKKDPVINFKNIVNYTIYLKKYNKLYKKNKKNKFNVKQNFLFSYLKSLLKTNFNYVIPDEDIFRWINAFKMIGLHAFKKTIRSINYYSVVDNISDMVNYFITVAINNNYAEQNA